MNAEHSDIAPKDRGQVRLMFEAGLTISDCARYFGASDAAVQRVLEELRGVLGPEKVRGATMSEEQIRTTRRDSQQARAIELAHELNRLLGWLCEHPGNGRGSCMEKAWDLIDEAIWLLDPDDDRPMPRLREKAEARP